MNRNLQISIFTFIAFFSYIAAVIIVVIEKRMGKHEHRPEVLQKRQCDCRIKIRCKEILNVLWK